MKNEQFKMFLKKNNLDVESVTSPMFNIPTVVKNWHSKTNPLSKSLYLNKINIGQTTPAYKRSEANLKKTNKAGYRNDIKEAVDESYLETQIEYLNDLENDLDNDYKEVNIRRKRSSVYDCDTVSDDSVLIDKVKHKKINNIFNENPDFSKEITNVNLVSNPTENDLEITIINFNKIDKKQGNYKLVTNIDDTVSTKSLKKWPEILRVKKKQNKDKSLQIKKNKSVINFNKDAHIISTHTIEEVTTFDMKQLPNKVKEKSKDEQYNLKKRVEISGNSNNHDVLHNFLNKNATPDIDRDIGKTLCGIIYKLASGRCSACVEPKTSSIINSKLHQAPQKITRVALP